ncbi:response regulator transcription factor [Candidatus Sumerlaeota bacterium]|nr:response regulator transcription factor [Candidatus Sumerlaeota bacterium]MBI3735656.1 response regulator transcription factor [Candidatus Sumerlaeota bacterium]
MEATRIVIAEDETHMAHYLGHHLVKAGYAVRTALDGLDALAAVEEFHPAAVLLDVEMPGANGIEVCKRLRADPRHAGLVIILVTGHSFGERGPEMAAIGADWCFSKPISPSNLKAKLIELGVKPEPGLKEPEA